MHRSILLAALSVLILSAQAQAGSEAYAIFSVALKSVSEPVKNITVEVYSMGGDGLFVRVDSKTVGKLAIIETDPKFVFKRYLAKWDQVTKKFGFSLEHRTVSGQDGDQVEVSGWKLTYLKKRFIAENPKVITFPKADSKVHKVFMKTIFAEKPGGMKLGDIANLLYPLPVEPYDHPSDSVDYFDDAVTGVRMTSARFSVTSHIPTKHILAYVRGTTLTVRAGLATDTASEDK